jgi:hypothetical protein
MPTRLLARAKLFAFAASRLCVKIIPGVRCTKTNYKISRKDAKPQRSMPHVRQLIEPRAGRRASAPSRYAPEPIRQSTFSGASEHYAAAILDSIFSNPEHANSLLDQAQQAGKRVSILYVNRPRAL